MKSKFAREIALLTLPVLLIGVVAMWHGKIKSWSGFGAPWGLYEGKPRLEITEWEKAEPTALDFGRGISSRWKVTTWHGGACPADGKTPQYGGMRMPENLYFAWTRAGKWHKTPFKYQESELDVLNLWRRHKPISNEVQLGLPMDLVPKDAEEVRLRGRLDGWMMCQSGSVAVPGAPLDVPLKAPGEIWPQYAGSRVPILKFQGASQKWLYPDLAKNPDAVDLEVEALFSYSGDSLNGSLFKARSWVCNSQGKSVMAVLTSEWYDVRDQKARSLWRLRSRQLEKYPGPLTLKSWVYVDKNEWPLLVSIPLKLAPATKNQGRTTKLIR